MESRIIKYLQWGTLISTVGLITSVIIQILARFILPQAPPWTEEASRIFFIYSIAFSAGLAFISNEFVYLEWFFNKLPKKIQNTLHLIINGLICVLFALMLVYSIQFTQNGWFEFSPGIKIRMAFAFFSIVLMSIVLSYFSFQKMIDHFKNWRT